MLAEQPSPAPSYQYWHYSPGVAEQDIYTIPLEAALLYGINSFHTPTSHPIIKFQQEVNPEKRNPSRHTKYQLVPGFAIWTLGSFLYTNSQSMAFPVANHFRGMMHAVLVTEIATSFAKVTVRRPRPFLQAEQKQGHTIRKDDHYSFFSGHASHAFNLASYTTGMISTYTPCVTCSIAFGTVAYGIAASIASARAIDGQHNWSDVAVGSLVGFSTGFLMQKRVAEVARTKSSVLVQPQVLQFSERKAIGILIKANLK